MSNDEWVEPDNVDDMSYDEYMTMKYGHPEWMDDDDESDRVCTDPTCGYPGRRRDPEGERYHLEDDHGPYPYLWEQ